MATKSKGILSSEKMITDLKKLVVDCLDIQIKSEEKTTKIENYKLT
jgi:hypothetical protein